MDLKPIDSSPSIAQLFAHTDYCRLIFVLEDAPEFAREIRNGKWTVERDRARLEWMFNDSAAAIREAVKNRIDTGLRTWDVWMDKTKYGLHAFEAR